MDNKNKARIWCLMVYTIFGFSFLFSKKALSHASPLTMVAIRFLTAFLILNVLVLLGKGKVNLKGKPLGKLLAMGFIQPVFYFICESYGINLTSSAFAGVILGLVPVSGVVFGALILKEKISLKCAICVVLSVLGVALTSLGGTVKTSFLGTLMLLGAVSSTGLYAVLSKDLSSSFNPFERTYAMFLLGSLCFSGSALVENHFALSCFVRPFASWEFVLSILYLAGISSVAAFMLLNKAYDHIPVGEASIYSNFCTVVSIPAGILIMGDAFSTSQMLGIVVILISVIWISIERR